MTSVSTTTTTTAVPYKGRDGGRRSCECRPGRQWDGSGTAVGGRPAADLEPCRGETR